MSNSISSVLSSEELEAIKGGFGADGTSYALGLQGVNNCCNTTVQPGQNTKPVQQPTTPVVP